MRYVRSDEVERGWSEGLAAAGLARDLALICETLDGLEGGQAAGNVLLDSGATAMSCASDLLALGAIRAVQESARSVPTDASVVGSDAGLNAYVAPALTSVQQPFEAMAHAVLQRLGAATEPEGAGRELRFRPELVVRASTGAIRAGGPGER